MQGPLAHVGQSHRQRQRLHLPDVAGMAIAERPGIGMWPRALLHQEVGPFRRRRLWLNAADSTLPRLGRDGHTKLEIV